MFLMRADPLRGQVGGGWDLEIVTFLGPEMATREASAICAQKSRDGAVTFKCSHRMGDGRIRQKTSAPLSLMTTY
jgi:hypothetical protein